MKLKKKAKRIILVLIVVFILTVGVLFYLKNSKKEEPVKETKIVNEVENFEYKLKENKPKKYKEMFDELKEILTKEEIDEDAYVRKISEMFIYDFYSLNDKTAKTDIGGVDFVYGEVLENFLQNAQNTYYKYVESNIYNNRKQSLPVVSEISIDNVEQKPFAYGDKNDEAAFYVDASWSYTDDQFQSYQRKATLVFIHDADKLSLVELQ